MDIHSSPSYSACVDSGISTSCMYHMESIDVTITAVLLLVDTVCNMDTRSEKGKFGLSLA